MIYYTVVVQTWPTPDGSDAQGDVTFQLTPGFVDVDDGIEVPAKKVTATLLGNSIAQPLAANDAPGVTLDPPTSQYYVVEDVMGAPATDYYVSVPAVPPGARSVTDAVSTIGSAFLSSSTAAFTGGDLEKYVFCPAFPAGAQIIGIISGTQVQLSVSATETATGLTAVIGASVELAAIRPA